MTGIINMLIPLENTTHWILQGKGGVGKSFVAALLAQYLQARGYQPVCGDTDPVNSTFHQITDLDVFLVEIARDGIIVQSKFDSLFETLIEVQQPTLIDNGAATFMPLVNYLKANNIFDVMASYDKQVYIHVVLTAGQAKSDTLTGLMTTLELIKDTGVKVVVWLNEFWGVLDVTGKTEQRPEWLKKHAKAIQGIVRIAERPSEDFISSLRQFNERHLTYRQLKDAGDFGLLSKSRVFRVFNDVYTELDNVFDMPGA